jgi:hypothetical protein
VKRVLLVALLLAASAGGFLFWRVRSQGSLGLEAREPGDSLGLAVALALEQSPRWWRATHCWQASGAKVNVPGWRMDGVLLVGPIDASEPLRLVVVADARDAAPDTLAAAAWVVAEAGKLAHGKIDLVLSLGGMADDSAGISQVLGALTGTWPVVAIPGDREPAEAHASATAALTGRGVVDGTLIRAVVVRGVAIGLVPGLASDPQGRAQALVAGASGCVHDDAELGRLGTWLAGRPEVKVVGSAIPPRQRGPGATDLGAEGTHLGDLRLAPALGAVDLLVHGGVDLGPRKAEDGAIVTSGPLDPAAPLGRDWRGGGVLVEIQPVAGGRPTVKVTPILVPSGV